MIVLSFTLIIGSLGLTQGSLLHRAMKYREVSIRLIIATVVRLRDSGRRRSCRRRRLGAHRLSARAWRPCVTVALWQLAAWRPRFVYSWSSAKDLGGFGVNVVGTSLLGLLPSQHGQHSDWALPQFLRTRPLHRRVHRHPHTRGPSLRTRRQHALRGGLPDASRHGACRKSVASSCAVCLRSHHAGHPRPLRRCAGLRSGRIRPANGTARLRLSVSSASSPLPPAFRRWPTAILLALNRPGIVFRLTLVNTILAVGAFVLIGLRWGIVGVAASYAVVTIPIYLARVVLVNRMVGVSRLERSCAPSRGSCEATLMMTFVCWLSREALIHAGLSTPLRLVAVILIGALTYCAGIVWRDRELIGELKSLLPRRARCGVAATASDRQTHR